MSKVKGKTIDQTICKFDWLGSVWKLLSRGINYIIIGRASKTHIHLMCFTRRSEASLSDLNWLTCSLSLVTSPSAAWHRCWRSAWLEINSIHSEKYIISSVKSVNVVSAMGSFIFDQLQMENFPCFQSLTSVSSGKS